MCFSAEVSYGAASVLAILGYQTLKLTHERWQLPLAVIPSLFALHQFSEGVIWTFLGREIPPNAFFYLFQFVYVFIAYLLYPTWFPFAVLTMETIPWRRYALGCLMLLGLGVAFLNIDRLPGENVIVKVEGHSLQYPVTDWVRGVPYIVAVCLPFLLSSRKRIWWIGAVGFVAFLITMYFYYWTVASVWCFFAALISMMLYGVVREQRNIRPLA